jgi:signal transduction histidine kinase
MNDAQALVRSRWLLERFAIGIYAVIGLRAVVSLLPLGFMPLQPFPGLLPWLAFRSAWWGPSIVAGTAGSLLLVLLLGVGAGIWVRILQTCPSAQRLTFFYAVQTVLALLVDERFFIPLAAVSALLLPRRWAWAWLGSQWGATMLIHAALWQMGLRQSVQCEIAASGLLAPLTVPSSTAAAFEDTCISLVSQGLAFCFGLLCAREQQQRKELVTTYSQVQATQQLLAETVRTAERARIARELHDSIGHQLTAVSLHLELALQVNSRPQASDTLLMAQALAHRILSAVRLVVRAERSGSHPQERGEGTP